MDHSVETSLSRMAQNVFRNLELSRRGLRVYKTDGWTDGQTDQRTDRQNSLSNSAVLFCVIKLYK